MTESPGERRRYELVVTWAHAKTIPFTTSLALATLALSGAYLAFDARTGCYLPAQEIWRGKLWPLWTTVLLHGSVMHLAFSVLWLWFFGGILEPLLGSLRFAALCLVASFVSSTAQLAASDSTGIGMSGLEYALFGFAWASPRDERLLPLASKNLVVFALAWLGLCYVATYTGLYSIGNAAHLAGLVCGLLLGLARRPRWRAFGASGVLVMCAACVVVLFWCPWSPTWRGLQASRELTAVQSKSKSSPSSPFFFLRPYPSEPRG